MRMACDVAPFVLVVAIVASCCCSSQVVVDEVVDCVLICRLDVTGQHKVVAVAVVV